jgi:acyl-CoA synthetase (AMP-forming)/AMP-acid ligase II
MRHSATLTNDFLDPLFERLRQAPEARFGSLYNAGRWESASFAAFMERAARFTTALFRSGIEPGDVVPVILRHDLNGHAAFLGAMLAGAVPSYLPYPNVKADHRLYWDQHRKVFAHIRPKAIVVYDELAGAIERCVADLGSRVIAESATVTTPPAKHFVTQQGDATALLQHSSGTTGLKKGVALSYNAVVRQLLQDLRRPAFVSVEAVSLEALALLYACGYDRVQIVNQAFNGHVEPPVPAREGTHVPVKFNGHMSGLFGQELDPSRWIGFGAAAERYLDFMSLHRREPLLAHGWLDFHVTSSAMLNALDPPSPMTQSMSRS